MISHKVSLWYQVVNITGKISRDSSCNTDAGVVNSRKHALLCISVHFTSRVSLVLKVN